MSRFVSEAQLYVAEQDDFTTNATAVNQFVSMLTAEKEELEMYTGEIAGQGDATDADVSAASVLVQNINQLHSVMLDNMDLLIQSAKLNPTVLDGRAIIPPSSSLCSLASQVLVSGVPDFAEILAAYANCVRAITDTLNRNFPSDTVLAEPVEAVERQLKVHTDQYATLSHLCSSVLSQLKLLEESIATARETLPPSLNCPKPEPLHTPVRPKEPRPCLLESPSLDHRTKEDIVEKLQGSIKRVTQRTGRTLQLSALAPEPIPGGPPAELPLVRKLTFEDITTQPPPPPPPLPPQPTMAVAARQVTANPPPQHQRGAPPPKRTTYSTHEQQRASRVPPIRREVPHPHHRPTATPSARHPH
eukprot:TRINITY_DN2971_c0_g1_i1.p1 TRINITY_DN2971_c0_g1~~TRINITY_DN2971_c0_g1_i1.p1  ORF type:complete len:404 (-),score=91.14 TRINITY_DN2971_c0_g1_i1:89-1168(-)